MLRASPQTPLSSQTTQNTVPIGSAVSLGSATPLNVVSMSLQTGTYLIWGRVNFSTSLLTASEFRLGLSLTANTMPTQAGGGGLGPDPLSILPLALSALTGTVSYGCGPTLLTLAAPATLFLVCQSTFSLGSVTAFGTLSAMKVSLP